MKHSFSARGKKCGILLSAVLAVGSIPALAGTLPAISASEQIGQGYGYSFDSQNTLGSLSASDIFGVPGIAIAAASNGPIQVASSATGWNYAQAQVTYFFEVVGPSNPTAQIDISGTVQAFTDAPYINFGPGALASVSISSTSALWTAAAVVGYTPVSYLTSGYIPASGLFDDMVNVPTNQLLSVQLQVYSETGSEGNFTGSPTPLTYTANALADPYIQLDPSFSAANLGYSLEFSAGINNAPLSSTPEPATWAMLGFGVFLIIGLLQQQKRGRATIEE